MTSWALICDVWYLPPVKRREYEDPVDFAKRVKRLIAKKGMTCLFGFNSYCVGELVDLDWDGNLKRSMVPDRLKDAQKDRFYNYLARTRTLLNCTHNKGLKNIVSPLKWINLHSCV
jgi:glycerol-3-phosphate O-acyltransferase 3/4